MAIGDSSSKEQPVDSTSSADAATHTGRGDMSVTASSSPDDFPDSFGKCERPTDLSYDHSSLVEELRTRLAQQSTTRLTARDGGPRRKLIFACLSVSVLVLILGAATIFFRRQAARKPEPGVRSNLIAAQVSAPSDAEPHLEATPDSGTSETQLPGINPDSQPSVQSQPSTSTASRLQEETKEPADNVSRRLPRAVGKLTPHATTPPKVALPKRQVEENSTNPFTSQRLAKNLSSSPLHQVCAISLNFSS